MNKHYFFNVHALPYFISGFLILAESIFIYSQNKKSPLNASFSLCTIFAGIWLTGIALIYISADEITAFSWARYYNWLGIIFVTPSVYLFSVIWRDLTIKKQRFIVYFGFASAFVFYLFSIFSDKLIQGVWRYSWGFYPRAGVLEAPFLLWFYTLMALAFKNFFRSYQDEALSVRKEQTKLVIVAFVFGFLGSMDYIPNYGFPLYTFGGTVVLLFVTIIGYSIVNYRLMDIETVIHKTIAWLLTNFVLIVPFMIIVNFLKRWLVNVPTIVFFGVVGGLSFLFILLLRVFQPRMDRLFQRGRVNMEDIAGRFSDELIRLEGVSALIKRIASIIKDTLYTKRIQIILYDEKVRAFGYVNLQSKSLEMRKFIDGGYFFQWLASNDMIVHREHITTDPMYNSIREVARRYFEEHDSVVVVPFVVQQRLIGVVNLSKKENLKRYNSVDFYFLRIIKNQAAIALSNSLLYENMEEQVKQRTRQLEEAQRQLAQAEKLATMGTLAGGVAHEINNPLTAILTNAQMLLASDSMQDDSDRESLQLIEDATKRCRSVVQKLMTYARKPLETGHMSLIDLEEVITKVVSFLSYQLEQDNIVVVTHSEKQKYGIKGNYNELEQVFTNMILNAKDAIKKIKKSGSVEIFLYHKGSLAVIKIKDDGAGMSKDVAAKIFDPFFTTKEVGKGMGLGLSICQSIIDRHHGKISVESEPNRGTTFTLEFPSVTIGKKREKSSGAET